MTAGTDRGLTETVTRLAFAATLARVTDAIAAAGLTVFARIDLPLRLLVRAMETGTSVSFHPIAPVLLAAGVPDHLAHALDPAQRLVMEAIQP